MATKGETVLVVDDEEIIRYTLQKKLSRLGYNVISLEKAEDVLYLLKNGEKADLVITDIKLRKMDGIELLRRLRSMDDPVPVLIITGHGNVEDAISALRYGASDFLRKPFDLNEVVSSVRSILRRQYEQQLAEDYARYCRFEKLEFQLPVEPDLINAVSYRLTASLIPMGFCNATTAENITLALREATGNAMYHGNLAIPSEIRETGGIKAFNEEVEKRRKRPEYRERITTLQMELTPEYVLYTIEDQGEGFNHRSLPDPRDPEHFFLSSGRGLFIIRVHMDEIDWNEKGNLIQMKKYSIARNESKTEKRHVHN